MSGTFNTGHHGVTADAATLGVDPAETLIFGACCFRIGAEVGGAAVAVRLADGVAACGERDGFFVIHAHAGKGFAHLRGCRKRIGLAVDAFWIDVDETHLHGGKRIFQRLGLGYVTVTTIARCQPFLFVTPIGVLFGSPDILAAEGETECLQTRDIISDRSGERDEIGPEILLPYFS